MKYIKDYKEGDRIFDIYLCKHKQSAVTKNGKAYDNVILQDKTGTLDAKVWDPNNPGIGEFDTLDYIEVYGDITSFQGALQVNVKRIRKCQEGEYDPADYLRSAPRILMKCLRNYWQLLRLLRTLIIRSCWNCFSWRMRNLLKHSVLLRQQSEFIMDS